MEAYVITKKFAITRQEGDYPAPIKIIAPASISLLDVTGVKFSVFDTSNTLIFEHTLDDTVSIDDQTITTNLVAADTLGYSGRQLWECELTKTGEVITLAEGPFIIKPQRIENV